MEPLGLRHAELYRQPRRTVQHEKRDTGEDGRGETRKEMRSEGGKERERLVRPSKGRLSSTLIQGEEKSKRERGAERGGQWWPLEDRIWLNLPPQPLADRNRGTHPCFDQSVYFFWPTHSEVSNLISRPKKLSILIGTEALPQEVREGDPAICGPPTATASLPALSLSFPPSLHLSLVSSLDSSSSLLLQPSEGLHGHCRPQPPTPPLPSFSPSLSLPPFSLSLFFSHVLPFSCSLCYVSLGLAWNGTGIPNYAASRPVQPQYQHSEP